MIGSDKGKKNHLFLSGHLPAAFSVIKLYSGLFCCIPCVPHPLQCTASPSLPPQRHCRVWFVFTTSWHGLFLGMKWKFGVNLSQLKVRWRCLENSRTAKLCCLHSSPFLLLLSVLICYLSAGYCWIAQFFLHSFLDYRLTPWKKNKENRSSLLHCFFSLRLWRNFTPHKLIFPPQTPLWPPSAQSFVLLSFLHFLCPFLLSNRAQILFTIFSSNCYILTNSCSHGLHWKHHPLYQVIFYLMSCFRIPLVSSCLSCF